MHGQRQLDNNEFRFVFRRKEVSDGVKSGPACVRCGQGLPRSAAVILIKPIYDGRGKVKTNEGWICHKDCLTEADLLIGDTPEFVTDRFFIGLAFYLEPKPAP